MCTILPVGSDWYIQTRRRARMWSGCRHKAVRSGHWQRYMVFGAAQSAHEAHVSLGRPKLIFGLEMFKIVDFFIGNVLKSKVDYLVGNVQKVKLDFSGQSWFLDWKCFVDFLIGNVQKFKPAFVAYSPHKRERKLSSWALLEQNIYPLTHDCEYCSTRAWYLSLHILFVAPPALRYSETCDCVQSRQYRRCPSLRQGLPRGWHAGYAPVGCVSCVMWAVKYVLCE